jgi:hypothetical protein
MWTITHEKIGLLYHVETDGQAMTAVMIMMIGDAGTDGQAVGPMKRMIVVITILTTKNDVAIGNADVVEDHHQMDRVGRQADLPVGHQADHQMDPQVDPQVDLQVETQVDTQAGLQADLQEDPTTRDSTAYSDPSVIDVMTELVIRRRLVRIAVGQSWI